VSANLHSPIVPAATCGQRHHPSASQVHTKSSRNSLRGSQDHLEFIIDCFFDGPHPRAVSTCHTPHTCTFGYLGLTNQIGHFDPGHQATPSRVSLGHVLSSIYFGIRQLVCSAVSTRFGIFIDFDRHRNRNIAAEAFQKAVDDLKNELHIADPRAAWLDGQVCIQDIVGTVERAKEQYDEKSKDHSGTRPWLEKFSSRVMIYGKVFDALAQHHPEYVAIAWGAVKFVLMVCQDNDLLEILVD
jgi:hypothetical protein